MNSNDFAARYPQQIPEWNAIQELGKGKSWTCGKIEGWFSAKITKLFSLSDESVAHKIYTKLFAENSPQIDAKTLRWFTPEQLSALSEEIKQNQASLDPNKVTAAREIFQEAIYLAQKSHSITKQAALITTYQTVKERTNAAATAALTQAAPSTPPLLSGSRVQHPAPLDSPLPSFTDLSTAQDTSVRTDTSEPAANQPQPQPQAVSIQEENTSGTVSEVQQQLSSAPPKDPLVMIRAADTTMYRATEKKDETKEVTLKAQIREVAVTELDTIFSKLGARAEGTMAISQEPDDPHHCQLHLLDHDGSIITYDFAIDSVTQALKKDGKSYDTIGAFIIDAQRDKIRDILSANEKPTGSWYEFVLPNGQSELFVKGPDGVINKPVTIAWEKTQKIYTIDGKPYTSASNYVKSSLLTTQASVTSIPKEALQFHTVEQKQAQIDAIEHLEKTAVMPQTDETLLKSLFLPFKLTSPEILASTPMPYILIPEGSERGTFKIYVGFGSERTASGPVDHFMYGETIRVLEDGRIRHGSGRIFENFDTLKKNWALGDLIYDSYRNLDTRFRNSRPIDQALSNAPNGTFLFSNSSQDPSKTSLSIKEEGDIKTYEVEKSAKPPFGFTLISAEESIPVAGELIAFLKQRFGGQSFGVMTQERAIEQTKKALVQDPLLSVEIEGTNEQIHNKARIEKLKYANLSQNSSCYTLSAMPKEPILLTVYSYESKGHWLRWGWGRTNAELTEKHFEVELLSDGKIQMADPKGAELRTFENMDQFQSYLQAMPSVKALEQKEQVVAAEKRQIENSIKRLVDEATTGGYHSDTLKDATALVQSYSNILGELATKRCVVSHEAANNTVAIQYRNDKGKIETITLTIGAEEIQSRNGNFPASTSLSDILKKFSLQSISDLSESKVSREAVISRIKGLEAYKAKKTVEAEFQPHLFALSRYPDKLYALTSETDSSGFEQFFLSYVDETRTIKHLKLDTISDKTLKELQGVRKDNFKEFAEKLCKQRAEAEFQKAFHTASATIEAQTKNITETAKKISENANFQPTLKKKSLVNIRFSDISKSLGVTQKTEVTGTWVLHPIESEESYISSLTDFFRLGSSEPFDRFTISIAGSDTTTQKLILIDPQTGHFQIEGEATFYPSIEAVATKLGAKKPYTELVAIKKAEEERRQKALAQEQAAAKTTGAASSEPVSSPAVAAAPSEPSRRRRQPAVTNTPKPTAPAPTSAAVASNGQSIAIPEKLEGNNDQERLQNLYNNNDLRSAIEKNQLSRSECRKLIARIQNIQDKSDEANMGARVQDRNNTLIVLLGKNTEREQLLSTLITGANAKPKK